MCDPLLHRSNRLVNTEFAVVLIAKLSLLNGPQHRLYDQLGGKAEVIISAQLVGAEGQVDETCPVKTRTPSPC